jgi:malate dehydrogenase (oxaloacetate-decarboxylating)
MSKSVVPRIPNPMSTLIAAEAVYHTAVGDGVATATHNDVRSAIRSSMWSPEYRSELP